MSANSTDDKEDRAVTGAEAIALLEALARSHARDRERVKAGELKPSDLHFIPAEMARESAVRWPGAKSTTSDTSVIGRLQGLPRVFRGADLAWPPKTTAQFLALWKRRGLIDELGPDSDVFANLLLDRYADWNTALQMAMPSAVVVGLEVLREVGWSTQIPRVPTVAVDSTHPFFPTPHFDISRRDPAWFEAARPGIHYEGALPALAPSWALADMVKNEGWNHCGLGQDDIDWFEITEQDKAQWFEACAAFGLPSSDLLSWAVDPYGREGVAPR
jgi:hypothetical protein